MQKFKTIKLKSKLFEISTPLVMGIININPDSFYKESRILDKETAKSKIAKMVEYGTDIIDIGAMSSRPGAKLIEPEEEWNRLEPILKEIKLNFENQIISLDTVFAETARRALSYYGISIINDISAGEIDPELPNVVAKFGVPYIIMHMRGKPENMNNFTEYQSVPGDIIKYFSSKIKYFNNLGIHDLIIDPGFGFSKTVDQNYTLLKHLESFKIFELPILVGISRKSMINKFFGINPEDALNATTALNMYALTKGADIIRVHDVKEARQTVDLFVKLNSSQESDWV